MQPSTPRNLGQYTRSPPQTPTHQGSARGARVARGLEEAFASLNASSPQRSNTRFSLFDTSTPSGTPPNSPRARAAPPTTPRVYNPVPPPAATPSTPSSASLLSADDSSANSNDFEFNYQPGPPHKSKYPSQGWMDRSDSERLMLMVQWAMETENDGRDNFEVGKVHDDYWVATDPREKLRDTGVKLVTGMLRLLERVCDMASEARIAQAETQPQFNGAPCLPNQVVVTSYQSRYTSGVNPDARFARELGDELFMHAIAVPHASKFLVRKRHLMKTPELRFATARHIPNTVELWRFVAAPIVPALSGIAQVNDIAAANANRSDERKLWIARHGNHTPSFAGVVRFLKDKNINLATRDAILDMLCSSTTGHHPADDWYHLFTARYKLAVPTAVDLFAVAVDDAAAEQWPF